MIKKADPAVLEEVKWKNLPKKLFNTRLESKTVRAIDFHEGDSVDKAALKALILDAVGLNSSKERNQ